MSISPKNYDALRESFGHVASWAVWDPGKIGDLSVFAPPDLNLLNTNYIFIGLNPADHGQRKCVQPAFCSFHSSKRGQRDYKLRYAFQNTVYWGSYLTDLFKDKINTNGWEVVSEIDDNAVENAMQILKEELQLLRDGREDYRPILVAMHGQVYKYLLAYLGGAYEIRQIYHYSSRQANNNDDYRAHVAERLA